MLHPLKKSVREREQSCLYNSHKLVQRGLELEARVRMAFNPTDSLQRGISGDLSFASPVPQTPLS